MRTREPRRNTMGKRARRDGDEQDAFSPAARRVVCSLQRAGVVAKTKARANRRDRREVRQQLRSAA